MPGSPGGPGKGGEMEVERGEFFWSYKENGGLFVFCMILRMFCLRFIFKIAY